ncbi:ricin-type beta-trefoil lectin domain protein [Actinosynnema sp. NPDC050436]|uniref:ricin-type beta-trefoil lectin domain protein n=1 Tax=Actinosynnema sp. NPDC050436 TaxID=3155659 RepID=UPI0033F542E2
MAHRRLAATTAVVFTATLLTAAPGTANAAEHLVFLAGVDVGTGVWDATGGTAVTLGEFTDTAPQHWYWDLDVETFRNAASDQCLAASGGGLGLAPCDDVDAQQWERRPTGDPNTTPSLFANAGGDDCITHTGPAGPLVLATCDADRADQQWNIYLV